MAKVEVVKEDEALSCEGEEVWSDEEKRDDQDTLKLPRQAKAGRNAKLKKILNKLNNGSLNQADSDSEAPSVASDSSAMSSCFIEQNDECVDLK